MSQQPVFVSSVRLPELTSYPTISISGANEKGKERKTVPTIGFHR